MKNEKGLTLVEVLAVIVIGAFIVILISNTDLFAHKQYKSQSENAAALYDVTYAAKVITKEIRKSDESKIENIGENGNHIRLSDDVEFKYNHENKSIDLKDGTSLVNDIKSFYIERNDRNKVHIKIESLSNKKIETEIVLREGS